MDTCELAIDILRNSNDGNDLSAQDLKITEAAVNGFLNQAGIEYFQGLHLRITQGEYAKEAKP